MKANVGRPDMVIRLVLAGAALVANLALPTELALLICAGVTLTLRAGSLLFGWKLPVYKSRPPRS